MSMHPLAELADRTWLRFESLLTDCDEPTGDERVALVEDTRLFFEQRLSPFEQRRTTLVKHIASLLEQADRLCDELQQPRLNIDKDDERVSLKDKEKSVREQIEGLQRLICERDKELIHLRRIIGTKSALIGSVDINTDEVSINRWPVSEEITDIDQSSD
jgi:hypothetical protein